MTFSNCALRLGCVRPYFQTNFSKTSGPIDTGKAALGLGPDQIGTLISMATDTPFFIPETIKSWMYSKFRLIRQTVE